MTDIKAISFDGDGTLWDFQKVMHHSLHHVLIELQRIDIQAARALSIERMITIRNQVANDLKGKETNLEKIRLEAFRETLKRIKRPNDELAHHLNQIYLQHRFEDIELYEDVIPTLTALKTRYTIGLLSNGNSYPDRYGLGDMFQFIVFSQDYSVEKPDPRIFHIALNKAGCRTSELLHVGDSIQTDIVGARNAGLKYFWLNRNETPKPPDMPIERQITSLTQLLTLL